MTSRQASKHIEPNIQHDGRLAANCKQKNDSKTALRVKQLIDHSIRHRHEIRGPLPLKKPKPLLSTNIMNSDILPQLKPKVTEDKILVAFDFDKTLIDANSDTHVLRLLPHGGKELEKYQGKLQWIEYMQKVFDFLCSSGVKPADLFECLGNIPWTKGMPELLKELNDLGHDSIIVSDCNSVFISSYLGAKGMEHCFRAVYTNPAEFDSRGCLKIKFYHEQNWCELSAINLCKGFVLDEYIKSRVNDKIKYKFVAYVGDGMNDYCPMLRLKSSDIAFPRLGYPCHKQIAIESRPMYEMKARVVPWNDGFQIRDTIFSML